MACCTVHIHILEQGEVMDSTLYSDLIEDKFEEWCYDCEYLVCDFERCLRSEEALMALETVGVKLVEGYPPLFSGFQRH